MSGYWRSIISNMRCSSLEASTRTFFGFMSGRILRAGYVRVNLLARHTDIGYFGVVLEPQALCAKVICRASVFEGGMTGLSPFLTSQRASWVPPVPAALGTMGRVTRNLPAPAALVRHSPTV